MNELKTVNCEQLMTTPLRPIEFCIDGMLSTGLFILAGAPKVGKSWLALDMALSIAKGEKVLGRETKRGTALYLCLEDSYTRIQNRLFDLTSEPSDNLHFAIMAGTLGGILEKQIENFKSQHTDLKIIIVDTLQKIRSGDDTSYASDYKELSVLKNLADKLRIAILLVHHTRKCRDNDPFNMISGTTGMDNRRELPRAYHLTGALGYGSPNTKREAPSRKKRRGSDVRGAALLRGLRSLPDLLAKAARRRDLSRLVFMLDVQDTRQGILRVALHHIRCDIRYCADGYSEKSVPIPL